MSDDLIRRSDAIKAMAKATEHILYDAEAVSQHVMNSIPAVEPKQGKWIGEGDGYADGGIVYDTWYCSNCDHCEEGEELALPNFCPNCGADMRKGAEDD